MRLREKCRVWITAGAVALAGTVQAQTTTGPAVLPDTLGTVLIGDLPGFLDQAGALAAKVSPDIKPGQFKQQFGAMLGDPELKGLPAGSGLAVVFPEKGKPFVYVEAGDEMRKQWRQLIVQRGMAAADAEGLLVASDNKEALEEAKELAPRVKSQLLEGSGAAALQGRVRLARLIARYEEPIQAGIKSMTARAGQNVTTETAAQLEAGATMLRVYYALAQQVEIFGLALEPSADALTVRKALVFKGADKSAAPAEPKPGGAQLLELLPGQGAIRGEMNFDPQQMLDFTATIMEAIARETGTSSGKDQDFLEWMRSFAKTWNGAMAMTFIPGKEAPMSGAYAIGIRDEAAALQFLADTPSKFEGSSLARFYEKLGMKFQVTFEKNVRQYKEVPIHRLKTNVDFTTGATEQHRRTEEMLDKLVYDAAIVNNTLLYAVEPYRIEELIDAAKAGKNPAARPLVSKGTLPPNGRMYFDYKVGEAISAMTGMHGAGDPGTQTMKRLADAVKDAPPLLIGGWREGEGHQFIARIPAETMAAFVQAGKQAKAATKPETEDAEEPTTAGAATE